MLKKAMIMAAGVGSRLGPLCDVVPKPLVPVANIPVMDVLIRHISSFGIKDIIANTYYKAEDIQNHYGKGFLEDKSGSFYKDSGLLSVNIKFIKEQKLSGTAGGVKKCQFFFDGSEDFIVMSGDGLTDIDINKAYESHKNSSSIATIVVKEVTEEEISIYGIIVPDENGYIESFQEKPPLKEAKSNLANTGIYIFNYEIFNFIPENTFFDFAKNVFPLLMSAGIKIHTYIHKGYWSDIGSIEQYKLSSADIVNGRVSSFKPQTIKTSSGRYICGSNFNNDAEAIIEGSCVFGNNCKLGRNCKIINSVLWDNVEVKANAVIENSIILQDITAVDSVYSEIISNGKIIQNQNKEEISV